jgi:hypothetical protein
MTPLKREKNKKPYVFENSLDGWRPLLDLDLDPSLAKPGTGSRIWKMHGSGKINKIEI